MRWFLMSSPILRGGNLIVDEPRIRDSVRQTVLPLWNVWYFLAMYANAAGPKDSEGRPAGYRGRARHESTDVMDRYLLRSEERRVGKGGRRRAWRSAREGQTGV